MTILARNVRVSYLEIDIVARDGPAVVVVEVRARGKGSWLPPLATLTPTKLARLRRAARILWSRWWSRLAGVERVRFDVIAVDLRRDPPRLEHIRAAFL